MSNTKLPPPIRRSGKTSAAPGRLPRNARRRRWPLAVMLASSAIGIVVAVVAWHSAVAQTRVGIALAGFILVIVVGTAMLFIQRVLDVGVARLSGTPLISSFVILDKLAFSLLLMASLANGIVVALQIARQ